MIMDRSTLNFQGIAYAKSLKSLLVVKAFLQIGHSGSIYTTNIGKHYKLELFKKFYFNGEPVCCCIFSYDGSF